MNPPLYVDTSGLTRLVLDETEGPALKSYLGKNEFTMVSSELTEVELVRVVARVDAGLVRLSRNLLDSLFLLPITSSVRRAAGELFPGKIKSLDAIHLTTALEIKDDLAGLLTYDNRMADLANEAGLETPRPA